ncbi:murein L,D-transpeptidase catalytic domain family protein [Parasegetibacter sp. MAH-26]|uniref:Murein L,D-transpeptidase catalytic domain family protein n=2 Tax=Pinibacter aurantiacus TaxID=2851599 RepID=A0A9E2S7R3_9BACT|nr:murein L,D-transpeptidase catalytic domain family protein [Pinibacter aurantiacus]
MPSANEILKANISYKNSTAFKIVAPSLVKYSSQHKMSNRYIFFVDMHIASGKNRFFVYDIQKDSIVNSGLVAHGRCNQEWLEGRRYGNEVGCGCTSLGKYKVGNPYSGRFGRAYKLVGLDSTNSNAFKRFVVLHAHQCVPRKEVDPLGICQSDGCPTVSPLFLEHLTKYIDSSTDPILLYIYDRT